MQGYINAINRTVKKYKDFLILFSSGDRNEKFRTPEQNISMTAKKTHELFYSYFHLTDGSLEQCTCILQYSNAGIPLSH